MQSQPCRAIVNLSNPVALITLSSLLYRQEMSSEQSTNFPTVTQLANRWQILKPPPSALCPLSVLLQLFVWLILLSASTVGDPEGLYDISGLFAALWLTQESLRNSAMSCLLFSRASLPKDTLTSPAHLAGLEINFSEL